MLGPRSRQSRRLILTILTGYRPKSREMAAKHVVVEAPAPVDERWFVPDTAPLQNFSRVAGVDAPAFVERSRTPAPLDMLALVSPGLTLRPSLSGVGDFASRP